MGKKHKQDNRLKRRLRRDEKHRIKRKGKIFDGGIGIQAMEKLGLTSILANLLLGKRGGVYSG